MSDHDPFLFVHLPLNQVLPGGRLPDASPHRRDASVEAAIAPDDVFGNVLSLGAGSGSRVVFPPWNLDPFSKDDTSFTFETWLKMVGYPGTVTLLDTGFGPGIQPLRVQLSRTGDALQLNIVAPTRQQKETGGEWTYSGVYQMLDEWMHVAVHWIPTGQDGRPWGIGVSINGIPMSSATLLDRKGATQVSGGFEAYFGKPSILAKLAHFRIYTRGRSKEEILGDMDDDRLTRARYEQAYPIDLSSTDDGIRRTMLIRPRTVPGANPRIPSGTRMLTTLDRTPNQSPREGCQFEVAFRPGAVDAATLSQAHLDPVRQDAQNWEVEPTTGNGYESLCIRRRSSGSLPAVGLSLVLDRVKMAPGFGTSSALIDLRYRNLSESMAGVVSLMSGNLQHRLALAIS